MVSRQREIIAQALGAQANEIYFTAGGSESDNWALKATAEAYEKKGKHIRLTVSNTTQDKLDKEQLTHLFDRFYRMDASRNSETGGYGIGLSIAQAVVQMHKGTISVTAVGEHEIQFAVLLPIRSVRVTK